MKPRSKTSRKPLKKKQNGKRTTKKNTKKHKQTHQARSKKSRGMIGGAEAKAVELNKEIEGMSRLSFAKNNALSAQTSDKKQKENNITGYTKEERANEEDAQIRAEEEDAQIRAQHYPPPPPGALKAYVILAGAIGLYAILFGNDLN